MLMKQTKMKKVRSFEVGDHISSLKRRPFFKKTFLINPEFQFKFMGFVLINVLISLGIVYIANYFFFESFIQKGESLNLGSAHPFFQVLREQKELMNVIFGYVIFFYDNICQCLGVGVFSSYCRSLVSIDPNIQKSQ